MIIIVSTYVAVIMAMCIMVLFVFVVIMYYQLKRLKEELKHHSDAISDIYSDRK